MGITIGGGTLGVRFPHFFLRGAMRGLIYAFISIIIPLNKRICNLIPQMAKHPKKSADSQFITGWWTLVFINYALTFKTITQNRFICGVISRDEPSTGSISFLIVMLV